VCEGTEDTFTIQGQVQMMPAPRRRRPSLPRRMKNTARATIRREQQDHNAAACLIRLLSPSLRREPRPNLSRVNHHAVITSNGPRTTHLPIPPSSTANITTMPADQNLPRNASIQSFRALVPGLLNKRHPRFTLVILFIGTTYRLSHNNKAGRGMVLHQNKGQSYRFSWISIKRHVGVDNLKLHYCLSLFPFSSPAPFKNSLS
jgi:hypothetical protein